MPCVQVLTRLERLTLSKLASDHGLQHLRSAMPTIKKTTPAFCLDQPQPAWPRGCHPQAVCSREAGPQPWGAQACPLPCWMSSPQEVAGGALPTQAGGG